MNLHIKPPKLLLVWNESPENLRFFLFRLTSMEAAWARRSTGLMIGVDTIDAAHPIHKLNAFLASAEGKTCEVPAPIGDCNVVQVVTCGFVL